MVKKKFNKKLVWLLVLTLLLCVIPVAYVLAKTVEAQEAKIVFFYVTNADGKDILVRAAPIEEVRGWSHKMSEEKDINYGFSHTDNFPTTGYAEAQGFTTDELIDHLNNYLANNLPEMGTLTYEGKDRMFFMADDSEGLWTRTHTAEKLNGVERKYVEGLYDGWQMFYEDPSQSGDAQTWEVDDIDDLNPDTKAYKERVWAAGEPMPVILSTYSNSGRVTMYHDETSAGIGRYVDENGGVVRGCLKDALDYDKALTLYIPTSEHEFMMGKRTAYENFKWIYAIRLNMENPPAVKSKGTVPAALPSYELNEVDGKTLLTVALTSPMEGATIYYNDGTNPIEHSAQTLYKKPFTIDVTDRDLAANPITYYTRTVREGYDDEGSQIMYYYQTAPSFQRDSGDGFLGKGLVFTAESYITSEEWNAWTTQITKITLQYPNGTSRDLAFGEYRIDNANKTITLSKDLFTTTGTHTLIAEAHDYATRTVKRLIKGRAPEITIAAGYPMYEDIVLTFDDPTQAYQAEIMATIDGKAISDAYLDRNKPGKLTIKANYFATGALNEPGEYTLVLSNLNYLPNEQAITLTITQGTPVIPDQEPECQDGVYLLSDADDLLWFAEQVNVKGIADLNGRLTNDIDLNSAPWLPIGIDYWIVYSGTFDGNGYQVFGFNVNGEDIYQGLFGFVKDATIKNLTVSGQVNGSYCTGGIVGSAMNSIIDNCVNKAAVQGTVNTGGIVGNASGSSVIQNCSNKGSISGTQYTGGICGQTTSTTFVKNCINYGDVHGRDRVGGITGGNFGSKDGISVDQCVNDGNVTADENDVGGLSGYAEKLVSNCYNTGIVLGEKSDSKTGIGGIAGYVNDSQVTNCYNIGSVSCSVDDAETRIGSVAGIWASNLSSVGNYYLQSDTVSGIGFCICDSVSDETVGKTVDQMKALAPTLGDPYVADTNMINGGYPILAWQALIAEKAAAKEALESYKNAADYREAQKAELAAAVVAGKAAIDAAEDIAGVNSALADAKAAIDKIKTDAQLTAEELAAAKTTGKNALDSYKKPADYRDAERAKLAAAVAAGKAAIEAAPDIAEVNSALAAAKAAIDEIKTDAQLTADEIKSSEDKTVIIEMGDSTRLSKDVLKAMKESGKEVTFVKKENGKVLYSWTFDGSKVDDTISDIDLSISLTTKNKAAIDELAGDENSIYLSFAHTGKLPAPARIKVYVGDKYKDGEILNLYYFNEETKKAEEIAMGLEVKDGYVSFTLTHLSDYFLTQTEIAQVTDKKDKPKDADVTLEDKSKKDRTNDVATGDTFPLAIQLVIFSISLIGVAYILIRKRRTV